MTFQQGLTTFRVGEPILVENLSTPGFDEYILFGSKNGEENILDPQFLPGEEITYAYENEGVRQLTLRANKVVQGLLYTLEKSVTFDVGYAPNFSLVYEKRQDQSENYTDNYSVLGLCFDVNVFQEPLISSPKIYFWNYGQAITFSSPENNTQTLQYSSLGLKFLGATISNRFGTGSDQIQIRCIDTPILKINVDPDNGQFRTDESIQISSQLISGNGHSSNDVATSFIIQGITYSSNPLDITFSQTGTAGITLFYQSKILTGLSGATFKQYEIVEILNAHVIHVSGISGNDSWSGQYPTISGTSGPIKTLNRAAELASAYSGERNIEIQIQEGNYRFLEQSFYLNESNSGVDKTITYKPYNNQIVYISGGHNLPSNNFYLITQVSNPTVYNRLPDNAKGKVYGITLAPFGICLGNSWPNFWNSSSPEPSADLPDMPELYYNKNRMTICRWPKKQNSVSQDETTLDFENCAVIGFNVQLGLPQSGLQGIFGYTSGYDSIVSRWNVTGPSEYDGIWLHGCLRFDWRDEHIKIVNIDKINRRITLGKSPDYGVARWLFCNSDYLPGEPEFGYNNPSPRRWYAFNLLEELGATGEYFLDRANNSLYVWPPEGFTQSNDIGLSSILLNGRKSWLPGTSVGWQPNQNWQTWSAVLRSNSSLFKFYRLKNVIIDGLHFVESNGSGIEMYYCENVTIKNCKVLSPRKHGICIRGGKNNTIDNCDVMYTGLSGVILNGGNRQTLTPANNIIQNSKIINPGIHSLSRGRAIKLSGVGNKVMKNIISNVSGQAIDFQGNDHIIEYNNFSNILLDTDDAGAIYKNYNVSDYGSTIRYNFFNNVKSRLPGVRKNCSTDEKAIAGTHCMFYDYMGYGEELVQNNVFYGCGSTKAYPNTGCITIYASHPPIKNNVYVDCPVPAGFYRFKWSIGNNGGPPANMLFNIQNSPWNEEGNTLSGQQIDYNPYTFWTSYSGSIGHVAGSPTGGVSDHVNIISPIWKQKYPRLARLSSDPGAQDDYIVRVTNYNPSTQTVNFSINPDYKPVQEFYDNLIINTPGAPSTSQPYWPVLYVNTPTGNTWTGTVSIGTNFTGGTQFYNLFEDKENLNFKLTPTGLNVVKQVMPNFENIPFEQIPTYP